MASTIIWTTSSKVIPTAEKDRIHDLMNLNHFNDEDLIYKLIFADILDV